MKTYQKLTTCFGLLATMAIAVAVVLFRRDLLTRQLLIRTINDIVELSRG